MQSPTLKSTYADLPADDDERREAMIDLFGQHLFSSCNQLHDLMRHRAEHGDARQKMGTIPRVHTRDRRADRTAREAALEFARKAIDQYMQLVFMLFQSKGAICE